MHPHPRPYPDTRHATIQTRAAVENLPLASVLQLLELRCIITREQQSKTCPLRQFYRFSSSVSFITREPQSKTCPWGATACARTACRTPLLQSSRAAGEGPGLCFRFAQKTHADDVPDVLRTAAPPAGAVPPPPMPVSLAWVLAVYCPLA